MVPNIWIFCLEVFDNRYTKQWHEVIPKILAEKAGDKFNIRQIDGIQREQKTTTGAFLNFTDTNYWKSTQLAKFIELYSAGEVTPNDKFLFTDFWNPCITQIAYMRDLMDQNWELHSIVHAGAYDPSDILGMKMQKPWPFHAERGWYYSCDKNYYATNFHRAMFLRNLDIPYTDADRAVVSGQPHISVIDHCSQYFTHPKQQMVIWPHRYNADKQPEIIEDLKNELSCEVVITQKANLNKEQYYQTLGSAAAVFSCSLHENLGISMMEGCLAGAIPIVPDRCSYKEMYLPEFKYPTEWTSSIESYKKHKNSLLGFIAERVNRPSAYAKAMQEQVQILRNDYLNANIMFDCILGIS